MVSKKGATMTSTMQRLETLGADLPEPWRLPDGVRQTFQIVRVHAGIAYVAGHGPVRGTEILMRGRVGDDLTVEDGYASARLTALAIIASLRRVVGDLDGLTWLRSTVYVNAVPDLEGPALTRVGDGFSDVVNEVFADRGAHARATVGVGALAFGVPTIVEAMVSP
jgi:enamine deaminase RidA (YjgF/YER057c/UK114 family)